MTNLLRRLRGALGIGLTWAGLWVGFGILTGTVIEVFHPEDIGPGEGPSRALLGTDGSMGWLTGSLGATFATASVVLARRGALRGADTPKLADFAGSTRGAQWN